MPLDSRCPAPGPARRVARAACVLLVVFAGPLSAQGTGAFSGTIRSATDGSPLAGILVAVWDGLGDTWAPSVVTDQQGRYVTTQLAAGGPYYAIAGGGGLYLPELYPGQSCDGCNPTEGTPIEIVAGQTTTGIDFILQLGGRIAGRITNAETGAPLEGIAVHVISGDSGGNLFVAADGVTGPDGRFVTNPGLDTATYQVVTYNRDGYVDESWDDRPCEPTNVGWCTKEWEPVAVTAGETTDGIDFDLVRGPCGGNLNDLCLGNGRFQVRAEWREEGWPGFQDARPAPLTRDTGTFWFFRPENVELVVKVLDACDTPWNRYWVFVAGLSNLGVRLVVDDLEHDVRWEYEHPPGQPFPPVTDTDAFATCP